MSGITGPGGFDQPPPKQRTRWLWWVAGLCGLLSFIPFLVVAHRVQTPKFFRARVVACIACVLSFAACTIWPPDVVSGPNASSDVSDEVITSYNGLGISLAIWFGLMAYGWFLNGDYKEFLRAQDDDNSRRWHERRAQTLALYGPGTAAPSTALPHGAPAPTPPHPAVPSVDHFIAEADQYLMTQPPGNLPGSMPPNVPVT